MSKKDVNYIIDYLSRGMKQAFLLADSLLGTPLKPAKQLAWPIFPSILFVVVLFAFTADLHASLVSVTRNLHYAMDQDSSSV